MKNQFSRNIPALTREEQEQLRNKHALVVGCGGLGGYVVEYLARLGVGKLTVADNDAFEETNLNRQLLSTHDVIGRSKVYVAAEHVKAINPEIIFRPWRANVKESTVDTAVTGVDIVIDALDNVADRLVLEEACARADVPLVHGAIVGWMAQIMVVSPGSGSLRKLYEGNTASKSKTALAITPAFCAAIEVGEAVKVLCGRSTDLKDKVLAVDLEKLEWRITEPGEQLFAPKQIRISLEHNRRKDELQLTENLTISEVINSNAEDPAGYILYNGKYVSAEEASVIVVEDGDVIKIQRGVVAGG